MTVCNLEASGNNTNIWPNLISTVNTPSTVGTSAATGTLAGFVVPSNFNFSIYPVPPVGGLFQNNERIATQGSPSKVDFAPRVGFAWKPLSTDRFVVRSGAGYFYDRIATANYWKAAVQATPYAVPVFQSAAANYFSTEAQPYRTNIAGMESSLGKLCDRDEFQPKRHSRVSEVPDPSDVSMEPKYSI